MKDKFLLEPFVGEEIQPKEKPSKYPKDYELRAHYEKLSWHELQSALEKIQNLLVVFPGQHVDVYGDRIRVIQILMAEKLMS